MNRKVKAWFEDEHICLQTETGVIMRQSLLWYPELLNATERQRNAFRIGFNGLHWPDLDVDISFESFGYEDAEPSAMQRFFLTHKEIKISEFAKRIGIDATLLRNYINGFRRPTKDREQIILDGIHQLAGEYALASF